MGSASGPSDKKDSCECKKHRQLPECGFKLVFVLQLEHLKAAENMSRSWHIINGYVSAPGEHGRSDAWAHQHPSMEIFL